MAVIPVARSLFVCQEALQQHGQVDLCGVFAELVATNGFPHSVERFCVYAKLTGGLGDVEVYVSTRPVDSQQNIGTTRPRLMHFRDRQTQADASGTVYPCTFDGPGIHLVELFCNDQRVCRATLEVIEKGAE